jgi:hypothetical protein
MYKIIGDDIIKRNDNVFIPKDEKNNDYKKYLAWVNSGNTPETETVIPSVIKVSRLQARLAMESKGVLGTVESWVDSQSTIVKIWYQDSAYFEKDNPIVLQAAEDLSWGDKFLDDLFDLATSIIN